MASNQAPEVSAYDVLNAVADAMGYEGVSPEMVEELVRARVDANGNFQAFGQYSGEDVRKAYNKLMADARKMFAPA